MEEIPEDVTTYTCPVCGKETIWFECESWDSGDGVYFGSGTGPGLYQSCLCYLTQRQVDAFPVMDMCAPSY
jgi:hypothetical protein